MWCTEKLPPIAHLEGTAQDAKKKAMKLAKISKLSFFKKNQNPIKQTKIQYNFTEKNYLN